MGGLADTRNRRLMGRKTSGTGNGTWADSWIKEHTRFGNEGEASRLDLVVSEELEVIENIEIDCPIANSDHAIVEFEV